MMHEEFVKIAGYKVSLEDYKNVIEPMYMAMPDSVSKEEFVAMLDRSRFEVKKTEAELRQEQEYRDRIADLTASVEDNNSQIAYYKREITFCKSKIEEYQAILRNYKEDNNGFKQEIKMLKSLLA